MKEPISRRRFLIASTCVSVATGGRWRLHAARAPQRTAPKGQEPSQRVLPRWRGFNLINFFQAFSRSESGDCTVRELDLKWMRDWGFDFVRLPMDYWLWIDSDWRKTRKLRPKDVYNVKEAVSYTHLTLPTKA